MSGLDLSNARAEICIVGRCNFNSGIGAITYSLCESLARNFPVCVLPTDAEMRGWDHVMLPNGRIVPVCKDTTPLKVAIFCDVLWNGQYDFNLFLLPSHTLNYAYVVFDSDQLPDRWVAELNARFHLAVVCSPHLVATLRNSGVERPIACVPIALDLEPLLAEPFEPPRPARTRFCSVAAFHPRKGTRLLIEAFARRFADRDDVELVLHSNLAFGDMFDRMRQLTADYGLTNVRLSHGHLSTAEKNSLIRSCDVFVNSSRGEGYSIGPREALALGKPLVLSDVGGHADVAGVPGVFLVPPVLRVPGRYTEIDNLVFGEQRIVDIDALGEAMQQALTYVRSGESLRTAQERRAHAAHFTFTRLSTSHAELINPDVSRFRDTRHPPAHVSIPDDFRTRVQHSLGRGARRLGGVRRIVTPAYDGGFFSVFNAFISNLVWEMREDRCHGVFPDWDVGRMIAREGNPKFLSFCYGTPADGNIWLKLFEPLYGTTDADMNDPDFLYANASLPAMRHNEKREPLMTYVHAYKLYQSRDFRAWRRQYHRVFAQHVHLRPDLRAEEEAFARRALDRHFLIAAHVRHPSHTVEQPSKMVAHEDAYITRIHAAVRARGLDPAGPDWGVFLATDQDRVVRRFRAEFGDRMACHDDVRRTREAEDAAFDSLSFEERNRDGHQLQHLVAADRANWSVRMAREVVRDAYAMARCHMMLHVVSNVSTAVAYMNPELDMVFCEAA
jgi:glycosyltransferase involved in cell wall biosynthesis